MKQKKWLSFLLFLAVLTAAAVIVIFQKPRQTPMGTQKQEIQMEEVDTEGKENGQRETGREGVEKKMEPESEALTEGTEAESTVETEVLQSSEKMLQDARSFPLLGVTETVRDTFLINEMAFRVQVSEAAKNYGWPKIKSLTFLDALPAAAEEHSFHTSLAFSDGTDREMEATYREDLGYYLFEEPKEYQKRTESLKKEQEYLQGFAPVLSGEGVKDTRFLPETEGFLRQAGEYLYRTFGEITLAEIQLEYLLAETPGSITYRLKFLETDGEETSLSCTYYPLTETYSFALVEEYAKGG